MTTPLKATVQVNPYKLLEARDKAGVSTDKELARRLGMSDKKLLRIKRGASVGGDFMAMAYRVLGIELGDPEIYKIVAPDDDETPTLSTPAA